MADDKDLNGQAALMLNLVSDAAASAKAAGFPVDGGWTAT